jgi:hypothetical protein
MPLKVERCTATRAPDSVLHPAPHFAPKVPKKQLHAVIVDKLPSKDAFHVKKSKAKHLAA